ncbi:MAG: NAD(P)H-dependent oxidoreductase subunit E [Candidatus Moraniibacteriota bacterium]
MDQYLPTKDARATIKVCLRPNCCQKGAQNVFVALKQGFAPEEALVIESPRCLSGCEDGPNIAVNDNIIKGVQPISVVETVRAELKNPSCKADGIGSRSIDDLESVLADILPLDTESEK